MDEYHRLAKEYPGLPSHREDDDTVKIPLGWVIDKICGLRGHRVGNVFTHKDQALVIVSEGASAKEIESFAKIIINKVFEKTGIRIEPEVEYL
jgi:UDP-N-acetylmuramate dehydrogenase